MPNIHGLVEIKVRCSVHKARKVFLIMKKKKKQGKQFPKY